MGDHHSFEIGELDLRTVDALRWAALDEVSLGTLLDAQLAAWHHDRHLVVDQPLPHKCRRHGAGAGAGGEGVTGAPLPDLDPRPRAVEDLDQLNVGPLRE